MPPARWDGLKKCAARRGPSFGQHWFMSPHCVLTVMRCCTICCFSFLPRELSCRPECSPVPSRRHASVSSARPSGRRLPIHPPPWDRVKVCAACQWPGSQQANSESPTTGLGHLPGAPCSVKRTLSTSGQASWRTSGNPQATATTTTTAVGQQRMACLTVGSHPKV